MNIFLKNNQAKFLIRYEMKEPAAFSWNDVMATILKVPHQKFSYCTYSEFSLENQTSEKLFFIRAKGCKTVFDMHYVKQKQVISKTKK